MIDAIKSISLKVLILIIFITIALLWLRYLGVPLIAFLQSFFIIACVILVLLILGLCALNKK